MSFASVIRNLAAKVFGLMARSKSTTKTCPDGTVVRANQKCPIGGGGTSQTPVYGSTVPSPLTGTFTLAENAAAAAVAGALVGVTSGSTLSLINNAGGRVALSGSNVVRGSTALDYETATSHSFTVRETNASTFVSPGYNDTVLSLAVTNVNDSQPNAFTLVDVSGASTSALQTSNTITIAGLSSADNASASISGDSSSQMQKNSGTWGTSPVTVVNDDTITLRHTSSSLVGTSVSTVLTISNKSDTFTSTTAAAFGGVIYNTAIGEGVDANGFTTLTLRPTVAKRIYVGSGGSDSNTGASHSQRYATLAKAVTQILPGAGDQVLIAEGTTLAETVPQGGDSTGWLAAFYGFSRQYPTVFSSYDPADPTNTAKIGMGHQRSARPVLTKVLANNLGNGTYANIAIKGLDFNSGNLAGLSGLSFQGAASGILVENCLVRYQGISYDTGEGQDVPPTATDFVVRNNAIYGGYTTATAIGGGGVYIAGNASYTLEDNVFWHIGWKVGANRDDDYTIGGPTIFRHAHYCQTNTGGIIRRNLSMDCAADGGIARGDVEHYENVIIRCPSGVGLGGGPAYNTERPSGINIQCSYNLLLAAIDLNTANARGDGISTTNGRPGSRVHHNLLIRSTVAGGDNAIMFSNSAAFNQPSYAAYEYNVGKVWATTTPYYTGGGVFPAQSFATYNYNVWDTTAAGTNINNGSASFPNPYTEAQLYSALGLADYAALVTASIAAPEQHYQRTLRSLAFYGYGMS